jgi:hypothetical protein
MTTTYSDITITGTLRVRNPKTDGFDYDLTWNDGGLFTVTHGGKVAGYIELDRRMWRPWATAEFGEAFSGPLHDLGSSDTLADAVAAIDAHWAEDAQ